MSIGTANTPAAVPGPFNLPSGFAPAPGEPTSASDPAGWDKTARQLHEIRQLVLGWDGEDAPAPPTDLTDSAIRLVAELRRRGDWPPPARAVASFDGTVVIEWQRPGVVMELEVTAPGRGESTTHRRGEPARLEPISW